MDGIEALKFYRYMLSYFGVPVREPAVTVPAPMPPKAVQEPYVPIAERPVPKKPRATAAEQQPAPAADTPALASGDVSKDEYTKLLHEKIQEVLELHADAGVTGNELLAATDVTPNELRGAIHTLRASGLLVQTGIARGTRYYAPGMAPAGAQEAALPQPLVSRPASAPKAAPVAKAAPAPAPEPKPEPAEVFEDPETLCLQCGETQFYVQGKAGPYKTCSKHHLGAGILASKAVRNEKAKPAPKQKPEPAPEPEPAELEEEPGTEPLEAEPEMEAEPEVEAEPETLDAEGAAEAPDVNIDMATLAKSERLGKVAELYKAEGVSVADMVAHIRANMANMPPMISTSNVWEDRITRIGIGIGMDP
jgi:hypothetical protein